MALLGYLEIISALVCFLYLWSSRSYKSGRGWPFVGMFISLIQHVNNIHQRCAVILSRTGGTFLFRGPWFTNMNMLATVDPANVHHIMSANFLNFPKGKEFREIFDVLGDGIFNSDDDLWKRQRKMTRALLHHRSFYSFLLKTSWDKVEKGLIPVLEHVAGEGMVVDMQDLFQRFTFDTTCILVTGFDPGCLSVHLPDVPFSKAMDDAEEIIFKRHVIPRGIWKLEKWLGVWHERKMKKARETLDSVVGELISKKRKELSGVGKITSSNATDVLTTLIMNENDDEITMGLTCNDKLFRDLILNLMIAGRDTTSSSLTWFTWLVFTHPTIMNKIRDEIRSTIPTSEKAGGLRLFKAEEVNKMVYLHAAFCEALRLYPPVPFQHKSPLKPDVLPSGHYVHPKMKVLFSLYAMARMKFIWGDDCYEFKPERWISERGTVKHEPSYKFMAFNAGPRTCLGKEVAFTQMKAAAAAILHNYDVKVVEGHPVEPNVSIILYMRHGLKVRISKRWP